MSIDDPGWGGLIEEEPGAPEPGATEPAPPAAGQRPPGRAEPPAPPAPPARNRRRKILIVAAAVVVLGGAGAGIALGLGSSKPASSSTTTTTTTSAPGANTGGAGPTGAGEPSLIGVVPSALSGACSATPAANRVSSQATDEVGCDAEPVSGSSADFIGYVRFASASAASSYFSSVLDGNSLTSGTGDCGTASLSGTTSNGSYCEGSYSDSDGNSGQDLAFVGQSFDVGGPAGSTSAFCQSNFPGSSGASVVVWTSPGDDSAGFAVDCTSSTSSFVDGMLQNLVHADYVLND